jgi:DNA-binding MurR/RpiR family transcriptional regulator
MKQLALPQRVLDTYDEMPRGERRLADLVLEEPRAVLDQSASELAVRAGVSKATAARFFKRLGYSSFRAAKHDARSLAGPQRGIAPAPTGHPPLELSAHLQTEVQNLVKTIEQQRSDEVTKALRALAHGEKLWVIGFGDDYPLAHLARALLIRVRPDIRMIPIGGFSIPEEFASLSPADTVLGFGVGRRTRALRNVLRSARHAGAQIVFVTDLTGRLEGEGIVLRCRARGLGAFDSFTGAVSLLHYLCAALAQRIGEPAMDRLRVIDEIHAEWNELVGLGG